MTFPCDKWIPDTEISQPRSNFTIVSTVNLDGTSSRRQELRCGDLVLKVPYVLPSFEAMDLLQFETLHAERQRENSSWSMHGMRGYRKVVL